MVVLVSAGDFVSNDELKLQLLRLRAEHARAPIAAGETVECSVIP